MGAIKRRIKVKMTKYECGHESDGVIILDSNPLSFSEYLEWANMIVFRRRK